MDFSKQSDRISRYAVALQGAVRKTINVKLNTAAQNPITAMQVDKQQQLISTRTVQPLQSGEDFDFTDDGELYFVEGTEAPSLENILSGVAGNHSFAMMMEISENEMQDRDVTTKPIDKKPDEA